MKNTRRFSNLLAIGLIMLVAALAACQPGYGSSPTPSPQPVVTPTPTPAATPSATASYTVKTASKTGLGDYLVDGKGMTLYYFTRDAIGKSTATGGVLAAWPIFNAANPVVPPSLKAADFSTITRDDGQKIATYRGWPLYYYAKDQAAGDTLGEAVGGIWFVMKAPFYTVMLQTKADIGNYLVDAKGMTLYYFANDSPGKSTASSAVLANWPVFNAADFVVPSNLKATDFGTITRDDGQKMATYKGWPLYYFAKDQASGDTSGQGVNNIWFVISPEKFPPQPTPTPTPTPAPTAAPGPSVSIDLTAQGFSFDKSTITVPAGAIVTIHFVNKDSAPHNFAAYETPAAQKSIFLGQIVTGPAGTMDYRFTAPATPGTYFFRCDVHPNMSGSFVVSAKAP